MNQIMQVEQIMELARALSPLDKLKLIERLAPDLEEALSRVSKTPAAPEARRALRGLMRGCAIGDSEIQETRQEMWRGFPRENF